MNPNPVEVIQDTKYPSMFRLKWEDGVLSEDFYNISRANDILRNYERYRADMAMAGSNGPRSRKNRLAGIHSRPADALKPQQGTHVA